MPSLPSLPTIAALVLAALLFPDGAGAQDKHGADHIRRDIERHRAMATAPEAAARCLEARQPYDSCLSQLQAACKGLGIGKYCGMKHVH
jgi:hypothetical protein